MPLRFFSLIGVPVAVPAGFLTPRHPPDGEIRHDRGEPFVHDAAHRCKTLLARSAKFRPGSVNW